MKKVLSLVLSFVVAMSLVGCSGGNNQAATSQSNGYLVENGKLRVAMECAYAPYNWTQPNADNGAVKISGSSDYAYGYDVIMAKKIAEELGLSLEIVKLDWDSLVPAVISNTVDLVIAGQSITSERKESVDFSKPYYYASIVTVTKKNSKYANAKSLSDLSGASATSQINTVWYDDCIDQIPNVNKLSAQESAPQMLVNLESDICDIVVTDMPTAKAACIAYNDLTILDLSKGDYQVSNEEVEIGISMRKGNSELQNKVNAVLDKMTENDYNKLMNDAIKVQPLS